MSSSTSSASSVWRMKIRSTSLVLAGEEQIEQREEALGEILLVLVHRRRHVHQAEHHRARDRLRPPDAVAIAQVESSRNGMRGAAGGRRRSSSRVQLRGRVRRARPRRRSRTPPPAARASRARPPASAMRRASACVSVRMTDEVGGHARLGEAGADALVRSACADLGAREVRQLEIVEEDLHELLARQREHELVLALALAALLPSPPPPPPPSGRGIRSPATYSRLPGSTNSRSPPRPKPNDGSDDVLASAPAPRRRCSMSADRALADHLLHRVPDLRLVAAQEALAVDARSCRGRSAGGR